MRIYKNFWINQVTTFNQQNEANRNQKIPYNFPTEQLKKKAEELGMELISPYKINPQTESAQVSELKAKNKELENKLGKMESAQDEMLKLLRKLGEKPIEVPDTAALVKKFRTLDKAKYKNWVLKNLEEIEGWPKSVRAQAEEKYRSFYPGEEWPLSDMGEPDGDVP